MKMLRSMIRTLTVGAAFLGSVCLVQHAYAASGVCMPEDGSTKSFDVKFNKIFSDPLANRAGYTEENASAGVWDKKGSYIMVCQCDNPPDMGASYITALSPLPEAGFQVKGLTGYILNDYLALSAEVNIAGGVNGGQGAYFPVPVVNQSNMIGSQKCRWVYDSGATGKIHLYFRRPFVGQLNLGNPTLLNIYISSKPDSFNNSIAIRVTLSGTVTVQQSCDISPNPITVELGDILSASFKKAGAKPDGFTPITKELTVACTNISEGVKVNLSFSAAEDPKVKGALQTTNSDIAIKIDDKYGNPVSPNNGLLPMEMTGTGTLNSTGKAAMTVYPINTTGNTPAVGGFGNVTGTVKVEIE